MFQNHDMETTLKDRLPVKYDGCGHWEHCVSCPFKPDCILGREATYKKEIRAAEAYKLKKEGHSDRQIGAKLGISHRTAQRDVASLELSDR